MMHLEIVTSKVLTSKFKRKTVCIGDLDKVTFVMDV